MSTAELPTTPAPQTFSAIEFGTPAANAFLRRVIRDNVRLGWNESWRVFIDRDGDKLGPWHFTRTIAPKTIGDPEQIVNITLYHVPLFERGRCGERDDDGHTVYVRQVRRIVLGRCDLSTACFALLNGCHLHAVSTIGSRNTSVLGLSQYYLEAENNAKQISFIIGNLTLADNHKLLTSGPVCF